jgi:hypothetical protein
MVRGAEMITQEDTREMAASKLYLLSYSPFLKTLLLNLPYNYTKMSLLYTAVVQQDKVDRVGFEPTTSATLTDYSFYLLTKAYLMTAIKGQRPKFYWSTLFFHCVLRGFHVKGCFKKRNPDKTYSHTSPAVLSASYVKLSKFKGNYPLFRITNNSGSSNIFLVYPI